MLCISLALDYDNKQFPFFEYRHFQPLQTRIKTHDRFVGFDHRIWIACWHIWAANSQISTTIVIAWAAIRHLTGNIDVTPHAIPLTFSIQQTTLRQAQDERLHFSSVDIHRVGSGFADNKSQIRYNKFRVENPRKPNKIPICIPPPTNKPLRFRGRVWLAGDHRASLSQTPTQSIF